MKKIPKTLVCLAALSFAASATAADPYPVKPIRLIVPAAAGGSTDIGARIVAQGLSARLGQPVIVENRGGGGGRIGASEVARADADGYTLLYGNSITQALLPAVAKKLSYDTLKDFTPVGQMFWYSTLIVCNPSLPFNDLNGMISYAKQNPGKLNIATAGPGSGNHFSSELIGSMAGIKVTHIPYKGNAPGLQDVLGGVASCMHLSEAKSYLDAGKLKALATTGKMRDPRFPNIPTVDEAGLKGYDVTWWQGIFAPAGTPSHIIEKLSAAAKVVASDPKVKAATFDGGFVPKYAPPDEVTQIIREDMAKFRQIATDANIELD